MNGRSFASHLVVAGLALLLGWGLSSMRPSESAQPSVGTLKGPVADFTEALRIEAPAQRTVALAEFFERVDPEWAPSLRAEVNTQGSDLVLDEVSEMLFASWWARHDPRAAFENVVDPPWAGRHPWVRSVMREWVKQDPLAAVAAVDSLPELESKGRMEATRVVVDGWFAQSEVADPTPLVQLLAGLEVKPRGRAIKHLIDTMIESRGIDATEQFVEAIPASFEAGGQNVRAELMARMGMALLDHDLDRAIAWANEHGQGRKGSGIRKHLAFRWGLRDGPGAMRWTTNLPDEPERPAIVKRAWLSFTRKDPDGARDWLASQEPNRALQGVYANFLIHVAEQDPERALSLARSATDPEVRDKMLIAVGKGWMKADPKAAESWLSQSELPPDHAQRVRDWAAAARKNS